MRNAPRRALRSAFCILVRANRSTCNLQQTFPLVSLRDRLCVLGAYFRSLFPMQISCRRYLHYLVLDRLEPWALYSYSVVNRLASTFTTRSLQASLCVSCFLLMYAEDILFRLLVPSPLTPDSLVSFANLFLSTLVWVVDTYFEHVFASLCSCEIHFSCYTLMHCIVEGL